MKPPIKFWSYSLVFLMVAASAGQTKSLDDQLEVRASRRYGLDVYYTSPDGIKLHAEVMAVPVEEAHHVFLSGSPFNAKVEDTSGNRLFTSLSAPHEPRLWALQSSNYVGTPPPEASWKAAQLMAERVDSADVPIGYEAEWGHLKAGVMSAFKEYDTDLQRVRSAKTYPAIPAEIYEEDVKASTPKDWPGAPFISGSGSGSGDRFKMPETDRRVNSAYQYKQVVHLWSQPWIWKTMHSATRTFTYGRLKCEPGDERTQCIFWALHSIDQVKNHGAGPGEENMKEYARCDPQIELDGWYQVNNECEGKWGIEHSCNDDTAGQINNAYGVWTGHHCLGKRREVRPWCQRHWG